MKQTWKMVNRMKLTKDDKNGLFLFLMIVESAVIGMLVWIFLARYILPEIAWLLVFIGYPSVFVGFFGGALYLYRHDFA